MTLRVGLDASAAAVTNPTGVAAAIRSIALALRAIAKDEGIELETCYRLSRWKRRRTFLPGSRLFHDRFSVLLLGELSARKNTAGAVRAFARARERSEAARRATLLLVGRDGHGAEETRRALDDEKLGESARVLGWVEPGELASLLASARALL